MKQQTTHQGTKRTVFSETCVEIMDFFLSHARLYFTPLTVALSMKKSQNTIKDCMNLLRANSYLTKLSDSGSAYYITKENMEFWHFDFKAYILSTMNYNINDVKDSMLPMPPTPFDYDSPEDLEL